MAELPERIHIRIARLSEEGNALAADSEWAAALARFQEAWNLVPEPRFDWDAALCLLASIGDIQFQLHEFRDAHETLMTAIKWCAGATENPFLQLRLGQALFELGERSYATSWLAGAYLMKGLAVFEKEDPKYLTVVKSQLKPPPGGWPEGW